MAERKLYPSERQERFIVRFPDGMRDKISALAKANGRSMNAEVISLIEASLSQGGKPLLVIKENTSEADIIWELRDSMQGLQAEVAELRTNLMNAIGDKTTDMAILETQHMVGELLKALTKSPSTGDRNNRD
jgi:hypothetical protein